jgi:hypothetical protein
VRTLYLLAALWLPSTSFAFTEPSAGIELDLGTGLVQHAEHAGFGWMASAMFWAGKHDDTYSLGKYIAFGPTVQQNVLTKTPGLTVSGEFRHGSDLLIISIYSFASAGAQLEQSNTSLALRAGAGARFRSHAYWSTGLRLELGADILGEKTPFRAGLQLTGSFARPFKTPRR